MRRTPRPPSAPGALSARKRRAALRQLVEAGYSPDSAVEYVQTSDVSRLRHSGRYSIQLQPPPDDDEDPPPAGVPAEVT